MDGTRVFGILLAIFFITQPALAQQARDSQREALDRLQEEERNRFQRELDEGYMPGRRPKREQTPSEDKRGDSCFEIQRIQLSNPRRSAPSIRKSLQEKLEHHENRCLSVSDIKALQKNLGNSLIDRGYISSRVLMPEQSLSDGILEFKLVVGRVEGFESNNINTSVVRKALPIDHRDIVRLSALEQAIENLNRVQGLDASLDLKPGTKPGHSIIVAEAGEQGRLAPSLLVNEQFYGSTVHGTARTTLEIGQPFGWTDRAILSANSDLDREKSDKAWGVGIDYDIGLGYWLFKAGFNRQVYRNEVSGNFQRFTASGETDISRLEVSRVLFRSGITRLTAGLLGRYSDVGNFLDDTEIRVSTYKLRTAGMRLDYTQKLGRWELGTIVTWEKGTARGPAADLPGGGSVADRQYERAQVYASLLRPFRFLNGSVQLKLNNQYSPDQLYSSEQFSLTAEVGGYEELAFAGNSGSGAILELSTNHGIHNTSLRPYFRWETGLIPDFSNEPGKVRLSAAMAGLAVHRGRMSLTLESAWPRSRSSTEEARNDYVARAALQWSW